MGINLPSFSSLLNSSSQQHQAIEELELSYSEIMLFDKAREQIDFFYLYHSMGESSRQQIDDIFLMIPENRI